MGVRGARPRRHPRRLVGTDGIEGVVALRPIHVGPDDLVVAAGITVDASRNASDIARAIVNAEARVRGVAPFRTVMSLEPRVAERGGQPAGTSPAAASDDPAGPDGST